MHEVKYMSLREQINRVQCKGVKLFNGAERGCGETKTTYLHFRTINKKLEYKWIRNECRKGRFRVFNSGTSAPELENEDENTWQIYVK